MARTKQKLKNPAIATGKYGKQNVCTIQPVPCQKNALSVEERVTILDKMKEMGWSQKQTAEYYSSMGYGSCVGQVNVSRWLKDKEKLVSHLASGRISATTCQISKPKHPELETALTLWVEQCEARLLTITGKLIHEKAQRIAAALDIKDIKFSDGWLASFKEQHMLEDHKRHGEPGSVNVADADAVGERFRGLLAGNNTEFLSNRDETGFLWQATENHGLSTKLIPGMKVDKSRITVLVIINATGTRKIQLFIGNAKQP